MKQNNWARIALFSGIGELLAGVYCIMLGSSQKDSWEYYLSSSRRDDVDMVVMIGWLFIIAAAAELIYAVVAMSANGEQHAVSETTEAQQEEVIEWIEGEIIEKDWDPNHHQIEWIRMKQKNGLTVKLWHYIADDAEYKVGDRGLVRAKDRLITEFISSEHVR